MSVNLMSHYWGCSEAIRTWVRHKAAGAIVNISSVHARAVFNMWASYDVAKAGIDAPTRYIAVEYGPIGIRANSIQPGATATALVKQVIADSPDPEVARREMSIIHPLERICEPAEVAAAAAWLLSAEASFVSGQHLAVASPHAATAANSTGSYSSAIAKTPRDNGVSAHGCGHARSRRSWVVIG